MSSLPLDLNGQSWTRSALVWYLQRNVPAAVKCLDNLDREQTLEAWRAVNALQAELCKRHTDLLIAETVPAGVDGYAVGGATR